MTSTSTCPLCDKTLNIPDGADGRRFRCPGCSESLRIHGEEQDSGSIRLVGLCGACGAERERGDTYCPGCGEALGVEEVDAVKPRRRSRGSGSYAQRRYKTNVRKASKWVLAVAVMFMLFGTIAGFMNRAEANEVLVSIADEAPEQLFILEDGSEYTVGELREQISADVVFVFAVNYGLALIMLACWFWSRRSPLPALVTALGVYVAVIVIGAIFDPSTIARGILIKVLVISALSSGVRSALAQRAAADPE